MNPGIYPNLSESDYFGATDWVSSSQLKRFLPEWYRQFTGSPSADFGSVFHERFSGVGTPVEVVDAATWGGKAAQQQRETITASGGYAILPGDIPLLDGMEAAVTAHSEAYRLLVEASGVWEVSVFGEVDDVPCKARFDRLLDDGTAVDVKTTKQGPGSYALTRAVLDYGYEIQQTHYEAVAEAADIKLSAFKFVFVQNTPPHHVTVVELDEAFLERGKALRELALQRLLHPTMVEAYTGQTGTLELSLPRWARIE